MATRARSKNSEPPSSGDPGARDSTRPVSLKGRSGPRYRIAAHQQLRYEDVQTSQVDAEGATMSSGGSSSEACWGQIMECQNATAHIADYVVGSLALEEVEALLTHAAACAACRDKLMAAEERWQQLVRIPPVAPDLPAMWRRFDAGLASYQDGLGGGPRNIRPLSRCATCNLPGQSCSWMCRRRFTAD